MLKIFGYMFKRQYFCIRFSGVAPERQSKKFFEILTQTRRAAGRADVIRTSLKVQVKTKEILTV